jgi:methylmalonyl-CoA mutase cobalamin-binding domain/chain
MTIENVQVAVETGMLKEIEEIVQQALDTGISAVDILNAMIEVMRIVGDKFQRDEIYVPEMLVSALTMKKGVAVLKPHLGESDTVSRGKFIIGTVKGDLHDIGKNLVALMVEAAGFNVIDLGVDVPAEKFIEALKANPDCKLIGISTLLTTTIEAMRETVAAINQAGLKDQVKIMVGGAPITHEFAAMIGADAYTPDAGSAAQKAKELVEQ